jgi:hypothetical protein
MLSALFASHPVLVCAAADGRTSDELFNHLDVVIKT